MNIGRTHALIQSVNARPAGCGAATLIVLEKLATTAGNLDGSGVFVMDQIVSDRNTKQIKLGTVRSRMGLDQIIVMRKSINIDTRGVGTKSAEPETIHSSTSETRMTGGVWTKSPLPISSCWSEEEEKIAIWVNVIRRQWARSHRFAF